MQTRVAVINTAASADQTLPEKAASVVSIVGLAGAAATIDATSYTIQTTAPASADEVQFVGTPASPDDKLVFDAALTAAGVLFVTYIPEGALPANA